MTPTALRRVDLLSRLALLLWAGAALGFGIAMAPLLFRELPSRDVAGRIAGLIIERLDWAAWLAFALAGLSWVGRWMAEMEKDTIGPIQLWSAALLVALLACLASTFIETPKVRDIRARINAPVESIAQDHPDRVAYNKAHGASRNLFFLRIFLALGLGATVGLMPLVEKKPDQVPEA